MNRMFASPRSAFLGLVSINTGEIALDERGWHSDYTCTSENVVVRQLVFGFFLADYPVGTNEKPEHSTNGHDRTNRIQRRIPTFANGVVLASQRIDDETNRYLGRHRAEHPH